MPGVSDMIGKLDAAAVQEEIFPVEDGASCPEKQALDFYLLVQAQMRHELFLER